MTAAVAISTTGDEHRLALLALSAMNWWRALAARSLPTRVFVTVDGTEEVADRVAAVVAGFAEVYRVGQPSPFPNAIGKTFSMKDGHLGVATSKNTGLELMMDSTPAEHLFLSDDDAWPLYPQSLSKHIDLDVPHSMVCWGKNRLDVLSANARLAYWKWPRGVVMYAHRSVVDRVGGMDERFSPGGHEHVEWSKRIHNDGLTPQPFVSPASYATRQAMGAGALWHAEDMPKDGEPRHIFHSRRLSLTTLRQTSSDWDRAEQIMAEREGSSDFVSYRAQENGRASATLCPSINPSQGAEESK